MSRVGSMDIIHRRHRVKLQRIPEDRPADDPIPIQPEMYQHGLSECILRNFAKGLVLGNYYFINFW